MANFCFSAQFLGFTCLNSGKFSAVTESERKSEGFLLSTMCSFARWLKCSAQFSWRTAWWRDTSEQTDARGWEKILFANLLAISKAYFDFQRNLKSLWWTIVFRLSVNNSKKILPSPGNRAAKLLDGEHTRPATLDFFLSLNTNLFVWKHISMLWRTGRTREIHEVRFIANFECVPQVSTPICPYHQNIFCTIHS